MCEMSVCVSVSVWEAPGVPAHQQGQADLGLPGADRREEMLNPNFLRQVGFQESLRTKMKTGERATTTRQALGCLPGLVPRGQRHGSTWS